MCGILGLVQSSDHPDSSSRFSSALGMLRHRGPDSIGTMPARGKSWNLLLGHTRLAILDLSEAGLQPMQAFNGRYRIVFNGEVYNYRELRAELETLGHVFRSDTDTEVLLSAWATWGQEGLRKIIGMFAFAILDTHQETLTIARDAFGVKPLYWANLQGRVAFSSEIPSIFEVLGMKPEPNLATLYDYFLGRSYDKGDSTFFSGVSRLRPGHLLRIDLKDFLSEPAVWRWWEPTTREEEWSFVDAVDATRNAILDSVRLHLRSDVPLGIALSGGIDSSTIASVARYLEPDVEINTFSFVDKEFSFSEDYWVDLVNQRITSSAHKVALSAQELALEIDSVVGAQAEPFGSTSIYAQYRLFKLVKDSGVTVILDGQGADELFAGYQGYVDRRIMTQVSRGDVIGALRLLRNWSQWPGRKAITPLAKLGANLVPDSMATRVRYWRARRLFAQSAPWGKDRFIQEQTSALSISTNGKRYLASKLQEELTNGGLEALLRHGDRNSMHWSVESRVPFLTIGLADLTLSFPEQYLLSESGETKHILRESMRGIVPDEVLDRKDKIGFQTPQDTWLGSLPEGLVADWLDGLRSFGILNVNAVVSHVQNQLRGHKAISPSAWRFLNAGRWAQLFL